jgi:hypothetical protein
MNATVESFVHSRRSLAVASALMAALVMGCASAGGQSTGQGREGLLAKRRYGASVPRVDSAAWRAFLELGYIVARYYTGGDTNRLVHSVPRETWDDCVKPEVRSASQHPGVWVYVISKRDRDSTDVDIGAYTVRDVPDVIVAGKPMNADLVVKMCAITTVIARMDTLIHASGPIGPDLVVAADSVHTIAAADAPAYDGLVGRLRAGDTLIDYTALRLAYANTPRYKPYPVRWDEHLALLEALERRRFAEVRALAESILSSNYADADAHLGAMAAAYSRGDSARGQFHGAVYRGLIRSIGSRSGRTVDSAIVVISIHEQYALLRARGLERIRVVIFPCGRSMCDQIEVVDRKSGAQALVYFDISIPQTWAVKHLRQE